jgi:hypothetical protein
MSANDPIPYTTPVITMLPANGPFPYTTPIIIIPYTTPIIPMLPANEAIPYRTPIIPMLPANDPIPYTTPIITMLPANHLLPICTPNRRCILCLLPQACTCCLRLRVSLTSSSSELRRHIVRGPYDSEHAARSVIEGAGKTKVAQLEDGRTVIRQQGVVQLEVPRRPGARVLHA